VIPAAIREAVLFGLETPPKNCVCREMEAQDSGGPCDACCDVIARAVLTAALTGTVEGKYVVCEMYGGYWAVFYADGRNATTARFTEAEAIAACNALNLQPSLAGAATPGEMITDERPMILRVAGSLPSQGNLRVFSTRCASGGIVDGVGMEWHDRCGAFVVDADDIMALADAIRASRPTPMTKCCESADAGEHGAGCKNAVVARLLTAEGELVALSVTPIPEPWPPAYACGCGALSPRSCTCPRPPEEPTDACT
jgi:hypothetical protein